MSHAEPSTELGKFGVGKKRLKRANCFITYLKSKHMKESLHYNSRRQK